MKYVNFTFLSFSSLVTNCPGESGSTAENHSLIAGNQSLSLRTVASHMQDQVISLQTKNRIYFAGNYETIRCRESSFQACQVLRQSYVSSC